MNTGFQVRITVLAVGLLSAAGSLPAATPAQIEKGKYLVERVGMCIDCHTPRNSKGEFEKTKWLAGAVLDFQPTHPIPIWAPVAPALVGLPAWTDEQAVNLMMNAVGKDGKPLRPPMPPFRLTREDAEAVVAYLRSLAKPATNTKKK